MTEISHPRDREHAAEAKRLEQRLAVLWAAKSRGGWRLRFRDLVTGTPRIRER